MKRSILIFNLNDRPLCPNCKKTLDQSDLVAKDFVVCGDDGLPIGATSRDECGWCYARYIATPIAPSYNTIEFSV